MCYVPARPAAGRRHRRIQRSPTRTSCRACVGVFRRERSVQSCVRDEALLARRAGRRRSARTMPAAAPPPPPRRTRQACSHFLLLGEAFACADSGRFGLRPVGVALGSTALPVVVRDGLVGAADEQQHGGFGVAVVRRIVQRCAPAGRRRRNRPSRRPTRSPDGPRGRAHPSRLSLAFRSARATTSLSTIAGSSLPAAYIKAVYPSLRTAGQCGGGEPRSADTPRIGYAQQPIPVQRVRLGSRWAAADG